MAVEVRKSVRSKKKATEKKPKKAMEPKPEQVTMFNIEKLGLRSGVGDLSVNWHHYAYGTKKGR